MGGAGRVGRGEDATAGGAVTPRLSRGGGGGSFAEPLGTAPRATSINVPSSSAPSMPSENVAASSSSKMMQTVSGDCNQMFAIGLQTRPPSPTAKKKDV